MRNEATPLVFVSFNWDRKPFINGDKEWQSASHRFPPLAEMIAADEKRNQNIISRRAVWDEAKITELSVISL